MGLLRLFLALSVVYAHSFALGAGDSQSAQTISGVGGVAAVEIFFVISGFYMALVLDGTYSNDKRAFYVNRGLRIFPEYWAAAVVTLIVMAVQGQHVIAEIAALLFPANALFGLANLTIFGTDAVFFLQVNDGTVAFGPFRESDPSLEQLLLLPQAWTLALELMFYAAAPWLTRIKTPVLLSIVVAALAVKYIVVLGILRQEDPWTYRSILFEIAFFLLGILLFRLTKRRVPIVGRSRPVAFFVMIAIVVAAPWVLLKMIPIVGASWANLMLVLALAACIPRLFEETKKWKLDSIFGTYSYPIYLSHLLAVLVMTTIVMPRLPGGLPGAVKIATVYVLAIVIAFPFVRLGVLVDILRRRVRNAATRPLLNQEQ